MIDFQIIFRVKFNYYEIILDFCNSSVTKQVLFPVGYYFYKGLKIIKWF